SALVSFVRHLDFEQLLGGFPHDWVGVGKRTPKVRRRSWIRPLPQGVHCRLPNYWILVREEIGQPLDRARAFESDDQLQGFGANPGIGVIEGLGERVDHDGGEAVWILERQRLERPCPHAWIIGSGRAQQRTWHTSGVEESKGFKTYGFGLVRRDLI